MKKNVGAVSGAEAELPETVPALKFPSELEREQDDTPFAFQKIDVREPTATDAGTAQTSAFGGTEEALLVAEVFAALVCVADEVAAEAAVPGDTPTRSSLAEHKLSKIEVGTL